MEAYQIKRGKRARALLGLASLFLILFWQCSQLAHSERQSSQRRTPLSLDPHFRLMVSELGEERVLFKDFAQPRVLSEIAALALESRLREYARDGLYIRVAVIGQEWVSRAEEFADEAAKELSLGEHEALIVAYSEGLKIRSGGLLEKDEQRLEALAAREVDKGIEEGLDKAAKLLHKRRLAQLAANRLGIICASLFFGVIGAVALLVVVLSARSRRRRRTRLHERAAGLLWQVTERTSKLMNSEEVKRDPAVMRLVRQATRKQAQAETIMRLGREAVDEDQLETAIGLLMACLGGLQAAENLWRSQRQ